MPEADPTPPFYLIVTDHDRGVFAVEGPMTDDRPWHLATRYARDHERRVTCGPSGPDRYELAAEFRREHKLAGSCRNFSMSLPIWSGSRASPIGRSR